VALPLALAELPAHRPDADDWSRERLRLQQRFEARPSPVLVVVGDAVRSVDEWVCNEADLDHARVLWIQDLGPAVTRRVAEAYGPREVWRLDADIFDGATRLRAARLPVP
jgi:hypothetical protein